MSTVRTHASGATFIIMDTGTNCSMLCARAFSTEFRREALYTTPSAGYFLLLSSVKGSDGTYVNFDLNPLKTKEAKTWLIANYGTYSLAAPLKTDGIWSYATA